MPRESAYDEAMEEVQMNDKSKIDDLIRIFNQATNIASMGIHVVDIHTKEMYYSNEAGFRLIDQEPCDYAGKTCHKTFFGTDTPCENCRLEEALQGETEHEAIMPGSNRHFLTHTIIGKWSGKDVLIEYIRDVTEAKKAEVENKKKEILLENANSRIGAALKNSNMTLWEYDYATKRVDFLESTVNLFDGKNYMENVPESVITAGFVHSDSASSFREIYHKVREGQSVQSCEVKFLTENGTEIQWRKIVLTPIVENGEVIKAIGASTNITAQKEKEMQYGRVLERLEKLSDHRLIGKGQYNLTRNLLLDIERIDDSCIEVEKNEPFDSALELIIQTAVREEDRKHMRENLSRRQLILNYTLGKIEAEVEYLRKKKDGTLFLSTLKYTLFEEPETGDIMLFIYSMDISEQVQEREILSRISVIEYDSVGLIDVNSGRFVLRRPTNIHVVHKSKWNDAENDYAEKVDSLIADYVIKPEKKEISKALQLENVVAQLQKKEVYEVSYSVILNGEHKRKRLVYCYLSTDNEKILSYCSDITAIYEKEQKQLKKIEDSLRKAKSANEAKATFLSRMSHEIRTPINAIIGIAELERQDVENGQLTDRQILSYIDDTKNSSEYLLSLVNDILDTAKIDSGKMELHPVQVNAENFLSTIMILSQPLANARQVKFVVERKTAFHVNYLADGVRVQQILMNLLSNAFKFTPPNGEVRLIAEAIETTERNTTLQFQVIDNGIGMSKEFQKKLFHEFEQEGDSNTSRTSGSGLGLCLAKKLAQMMNGDITCESAKGKGSTFTATIKVENTSDQEIVYEESEDINGRKITNFNGIRILLCEDHPLNQRIARNLLERKNCIVEIAEDGVIGVDKFAKSEVGYYDMILMDIRMPNMDGLDATRRIRELSRPDAKSVPIVAMSANAYQEDVQMSLDAGMNAHLAKPVEPDALLHAIAKYTNMESFQAEPLHRAKILLVDDVEMNLHMLEKIIRIDFDVIMARNGIEALKKLDENSNIVAVVTDIQMPEMDGIELIKHIRKEIRYDNVAILANTQYGDQKQEKELLKIGADDFVYKPVERTLISSRLKNVLARRKQMI